MVAHETMLADWLTVLPVLLGLGGGALLLVLRPLVRVQFWVALLCVLAILFCDALLLRRVLADGPLSMTMGNWLPPFGISFTADVLGAGFALAAAIAVLCGVLHMRGDMPEGAVRGGTYPLVLLLLAGVSGAVLTGDLFNLYVWFEVTLIASLGLLAMAGRPLQLDGTVKYGVLNFLATTLFLAGLGLAYGTLGTLNMADIVAAAGTADNAALTVIAALFTLAFGMKAAAFPLQAWLPAAYHTPPAVISAIMGGLLTKVGVYALMRVLLMLLPSAGALVAPTLGVVAGVTALAGPLSAIAETNLRRAIGFVLIGGVGVALLPVAYPSQEAVAGGGLYLIHAILAITALYLVAGIIERMTGQTDTRSMRGLYAAGTGVSVVFFVLMLAVSGVPPFLGFWPKLLVLQGLVGGGHWPAVFAVLLNALLTLIAGSRLWSHIFWRGRSEPAAAAPGSRAVAMLLTGTIVVAGLWPGELVRMAGLAAGDLLDPARYIAAVGLAP